MFRPAYSALASTAVLVILAAPAQATDLYGFPPAPHARAVIREPVAVPRIVYGPALPQYVPVQPYYLVDQGPSDDVPTNPYGVPESLYAPRPAYGYVDTDDYYGEGVGYGGFYAFSAARPHYRHRRSYQSGVKVYRGPRVAYWGADRGNAWHGGVHRPSIAGRSVNAAAHTAHHGVHRMHGHAGSPRVHMHARPTMRAPMRHR